MSEVITVLDNLEDSEVRLINDIIQRYFKLYKKEFGEDLSRLERDLFVMLGHIHLKEWKFDLVKMKHTKDERLFLYDMSGMSKNWDWDRLKLRQYFSCFSTNKRGPLSIHPLEKLTRVPHLMRHSEGDLNSDEIEALKNEESDHG